MNFLIATTALLIILAVAAMPWAWPVIKAWAATKGVLLAAGDQMMLFPTASSAPQQALHMSLYGIEARNWFVGAMLTKTLVRPPAPKIVLPS